jgi:hypothetical protein
MHRVKWVPGTLVRTFLIKYIYHEMPHSLTCTNKSLFLIADEIPIQVAWFVLNSSSLSYYIGNDYLRN